MKNTIEPADNQYQKGRGKGVYKPASGGGQGWLGDGGMGDFCKYPTMRCLQSTICNLHIKILYNGSSD
jgi:hypothetical protein